MVAKAGKEQYKPAGKKKEGVKNTVVLNTTDDGAAGEQKEVFLIKEWEDGTKFYINPDHLDTIDRKRLTRALRRANQTQTELWEILKDTTLSNSLNALDYFHQLVRTYKPEGATSAPTAQQLRDRVKRESAGVIERSGLSGESADTNSFL